MAEGELDKSEQATPFKLSKARKQGTVARGMDLGFLTGLGALLVYFWIMGPAIAEGLAKAIRTELISSASMADGAGPLLAIVPPLFLAALRPLMFLMGTVFCVVLLFEIVQTGIVFSAEPLKPDFSRMNPATGLKRLFTFRLLVETAKNILKMGFYTVAGYLVIRHAMQSDIASARDAQSLATLMGRTALRLLAAFCGVALLFVVLDQLIVRRDFSKKMAMSRREVRRETRDREGDPRLKQKRRQLHAEFSKISQSLRNLKGADVVITNPEHIALALRYDRRTMVAPRIVSVGTDRFAQTLKHLAMLYGIPVIENRALARALYHRNALNSQIPDHCYVPVADIYNALQAKDGSR